MVVMAVVVEGKKYKETAGGIGCVREYCETLLRWWFETITPTIFRYPLLFFILEKNNF